MLGQMPPTSFCLSFLPSQAMCHLRTIRLFVSWQELLDEGIAARVRRGYRDIAAAATGLVSVHIEFCRGRFEDREFIPLQGKQNFLQTLEELNQPFEHITDLKITP